jgi:hypothetical protein
MYKTKNMDSKIIEITICKTCKTSILATEYSISIIYYYQGNKTSILDETSAGPTVPPADNPPNSDGLGEYH